MIPDQWQKAKELFDAALQRPPDERLRFVDGTQSSLRKNEKPLSSPCALWQTL